MTWDIRAWWDGFLDAAWEEVRERWLTYLIVATVATGVGATATAVVQDIPARPPPWAALTEALEVMEENLERCLASHHDSTPHHHGGSKKED